MRWLPFAAASVFLSLLTYGCGNQDAVVTLSRRLPLLQNVSVTPQTFDFTGGTATVTLTVDSERGISSVMAELTQADTPGAKTRYYALAPTTGNTYQGAVNLPSNTTWGAPAARYNVVVYAVDNDGVRSDAMQFLVTVAAPDSSNPSPQ